MATNEDLPLEKKDPDTGRYLAPIIPDEPTKGPAEEDSREIRELRRVMELLEKADRAYKIYPSNSVILTDFIDRAYGKFREFLEEHGSVQLSVTPSELRYRKQRVLASEMRESSLPFKLYEGGLRLLGFFPGLDRAEMVSFLDVMKSIKDVDEDEDNVVTLLWEKDVAHITYLVMDRESTETSAGEADKIPDPEIERAELVKKIKLRDVSQRVDESQIDQDLLPADDTAAPVEKIYGLNPDDMKGIAERLAFEESYVPLYDFVTLLFRIFRMERDWDTFYDLSKILEKILGILADRGDYKICTSILKEMDEFLDSDPDLSEDHQQVFWEVVAEIGSAERIQQAADYLAGASTEEADVMFAFFRHLGPSSLPHLCNAITEQHEQRFMDLITEMGRENQEVVAGCLHNPNSLVARTMLRILAIEGASETLDSIAGLLDHEDPTIRLEAVNTLAGTGTAKAGQMLIPCMEDGDAQVRKAALRNMVRLAGEKAFNAILQKIEAKEFITRPFFEKRDLLVGACQADPARGVPVLRRILERNSLFQREKNNETRQCAALALGEQRTPEATEVLRSLQNSKNRVVREACKISLKKAEGKEFTRRMM